MNYGIPIRKLVGGGPGYPLPAWMKDKTQTSSFQNWVNTRYPNTINVGQTGKGVGTFGPQTTRAWNKYGNDYNLFTTLDKGMKSSIIRPGMPIDPTTVPGAVQEAVIPGAPVADWVAKARTDNMQMLGLNKPVTATTTTGTGSKFMNYI